MQFGNDELFLDRSRVGREVVLSNSQEMVVTLLLCGIVLAKLPMHLLGRYMVFGLVNKPSRKQRIREKPPTTLVPNTGYVRTLMFQTKREV